MNILDILALSRIRGLGNKSLCTILEVAAESGFETIEQLNEEPSTSKFIGTRTWKLIKSVLENHSELSHLRGECQQSLENWQSDGFHVFSLNSGLYPKQLKGLSDPPALLYCKGNLDLLKEPKAIAVIGTRNNSTRGKIITERTVQHFVNKGFCIVSGLALGIDAIAHQAALDNNGKTIAVLVDLQKVSPSQNRKLAESILANHGLLLSENPPGTSTLPALFVKRDRIQAGLSLATFAIETSSNGGTMHAVRATLSMGRKVYVPNLTKAGYNDVLAPQVEGIQKLIEYGDGIAYSKSEYEEITKILEDEEALFTQSTKSPQGQLI